MLKGKVWLKDQILSPKDIYSSQSDRGQGYGQEIQEEIEGEGNQGNGKIFSLLSQRNKELFMDREDGCGT